MKVCQGCDKLVVENDIKNNVVSFFCNLRKEYVYRSLDPVDTFPSPLDCDYEK